MRKMVVMIMLKRIITMIRISEKIRTLRRANDLITFVACVNCPVLELINMMNKNGLFIWMVIICNNNHNIFLGGLWLSVHRRPDSFSSFTTNPHTSQPTAGYLRLSQAMRCYTYIFFGTTELPGQIKITVFQEDVPLTQNVRFPSQFSSLCFRLWKYVSARANIFIRLALSVPSLQQPILLKLPSSLCPWWVSQLSKKKNLSNFGQPQYKSSQFLRIVSVSWNQLKYVFCRNDYSILMKIPWILEKVHKMWKTLINPSERTPSEMFCFSQSDKYMHIA